jgi:hypothetical protein
MGNWEADWNRDALERIVLLLFALADLADIAVGIPFLRRRQIIGILNRGEVEARAFVVGVLCGVPIPKDQLEPSGDATCLATRLRALAMVLSVLLARIGKPVLPRTADQRSDRRELVWLAVRQDRQEAAPDTS